MPYVQVRFAAPDLLPATERVIAEQATNLMAEVMGKRAEVTVIEIVRCDPARWFAAGRPVAGPAAYADIKITRGTNTEAQKAALLADFYTMLGRALGPLAAPNYVVIHEVAGTDWGYDGLPQAGRKRSAL